MEGKPTYREQSPEMTCKTRRIRELTPSAVPSLVARGFRASYRLDGLRPFVKTSDPVYEKTVYHSRLRWQPTLANFGRRLATRSELLRDNF